MLLIEYTVSAQFGECGYDLDLASCEIIKPVLALYGEVLSCDVETCNSSSCGVFTARPINLNCESKGIIIL